MKHKHAELIHAWADGAKIQVKFNENTWIDLDTPNWDSTYIFRIKPEPKPDIVKYVKVEALEAGFCRWDSCFPHFANLKLTFDGETGKLKSAEVIK